MSMTFFLFTLSYILVCPPMQLNFHLKSVNDNQGYLFSGQRTKRLPDYLGGGAAIGGSTASLVVAGTEERRILLWDPQMVIFTIICIISMSLEAKFSSTTLGRSHRSFSLKIMKCTLAKICLIIFYTRTLTLSHFLLLLKTFLVWALYSEHIFFFSMSQETKYKMLSSNCDRVRF